MSTVVINRGTWERTTSGHRDSAFDRAQGDQGTVRVWVQGQEFVFGPGESKTIWDDGIASLIVAGDARLAIADSQDGMPKMAGNASLSITSW